MNHQLPKFVGVFAVLAAGALLSRPYQRTTSATLPATEHQDDALVLKDDPLKTQPIQVEEFENLEPSHPIETMDAHVAMLGTPEPYEPDRDEPKRSDEVTDRSLDRSQRAASGPRPLPPIRSPRSSGDALSSRSDATLPSLAEVAQKRLNDRRRANRPNPEPLSRRAPAGPSSHVEHRGDRPAKRPRPLPKTHRIVDGDDLRDLAARYIGDQTRFMEIFEANRDILVRPDILPLGREIKIYP